MGLQILADKLPLFLSTMITVSNNLEKNHDSKHIEQACGFYHKFVSGKFIVGLAVLRLFLGEMYYLSKELQSSSVNWTDVQFEIERTKAALELLTPEKILAEAHDLSEKINVPLSMNLSIHNTRANKESNAEGKVESLVKNVHGFMQEKVAEEFQVRFESKNIKILHALTALDPSKENYLDFDVMELLVDHFTFLDINRSLLKIELERAKVDLRLGLPVSKKRCENLMKLITLKNTISTSTASVERVFSGMNRVCTKLRTKLTPEKLGDTLCISMNRDLAESLDIDNLISMWSSKLSRRVRV